MKAGSQQRDTRRGQKAAGTATFSTWPSRPLVVSLVTTYTHSLDQNPVPQHTRLPISMTPDQVMPSRAPPRNRRWRTVSSCRPPPSLVAFTSPHPLGNVVDGVQDALRVGDRQLFIEVQLLDECVGRNLYALLVAGVDACHHQSVLSILRGLANADGPGGARGLIRSWNRQHLAVTARNART